MSNIFKCESVCTCEKDSIAIDTNCSTIANTVFYNPTYHTIPSIREVIFNPPYTIVNWEDNTKTKVRCIEENEFNEEIGLAMAISRKYYDIRYISSYFIKKDDDESNGGPRAKFKKQIRDAKRPKKNNKKKNKSNKSNIVPRDVRINIIKERRNGQSLSLLSKQYNVDLTYLRNNLSMWKIAEEVNGDFYEALLLAYSVSDNWPDTKIVTKCFNMLNSYGIFDIIDHDTGLSIYTDENLCSLDNFGPKTVKFLRQANDIYINKLK